MVLPDRIELSTSPLPMECSTTELRQRAPDTGFGQKGRYKAADPCHKAPSRASVAPACGVVKSGNQEEPAAASFSRLSCGPIRFPICSPSAASALMGRIMTSNSNHFARFIEPDEIDALELPFADIGGKFQCDIVRAGDEGAVIAKILEDPHHRRQHQHGRGAAGNWRLHERRAKHNMFGQ